MREWGFDLSEATLKTVALGKGIKGNVEKMTQLEKSQLRYVQLIETAQRLNLTGDLARTLQAPANQLRILKAQAVQAARALGNIFIPALNAILPYAIAVLKVLRMVADAFANLAGFKLPEVDYSGLDSVVGGTDDIIDGMEDANKAAKELRNTILGFDQLNIMNAPTSASGDNKPEIGGGLDLKLPEYDFLKGLDDSANAIYKTLEKKVKPIIDWVIEHFNDILDVR